MAENEGKKIIIDEDWKEEAQREKEALAAAMEQEKRAKRVPEKASLTLLLSGLATQALVSLGEIENPFSKKQETDLTEARFNIDMLEMLQEKTKGNLSPEEARMLEALLFDLRMRFVQRANPAPQPK